VTHELINFNHTILPFNQYIIHLLVENGHVLNTDYKVSSSVVHAMVDSTHKISSNTHTHVLKHAAFLH
jgi:hypothetical protein